jgi:hypothetical protein
MQYHRSDYFHINPNLIQVIGDQDFSIELAGIITMIPKDIIDNTLNNCVFLMLNEETNVSAGFIHNNFIKEKNLIAFYCMFYKQNRNEKVKMVLHEIAHYHLGHTGEELSEEEYKKEEQEAIDLVKKWISDCKKYYSQM